MTQMPSIYETQRRHAACYCAVLTDIRQAYDRGGDEQADGLRRFDRLWPQIKHGQAWAAANATEDEEAARLCFNYAWNSDMLMGLKGLERESITWLKQAAGVNSDARIQVAFWSEIGQAHNSLGEYELALVYYDIALGFSERFAMHGQTAATLAGKGIALKNLNRYDEAKATFDKAENCYRKLGKWPEFGTLHSLANLFSHMGKHAQARYTAERALKLAIKEGDRVKESAAKHTLAGIHLDIGALDEALELALAAYRMFAELGESYRNLQCMVLLSKIYEKKDMVAQADYWRERAAEGVKGGYDSRRRYDIRHFERESLWRQGRLGAAREVANDLVREAQQQGDKAEEIQALLSAGHSAQMQGDLRSARASWQRALDLANQVADAFGKAAATGNLGLLRYMENEISDAIELYEQGLQLAEAGAATKVILNILGNLGNAYSDVERQDDALACYEKGLALARQSGNDEEAARLTGYIGRLHLLNDRHEEAVEALESAVVKLQEVGNHYMVAYFTHLLGITYWQQGNPTAGLDASRKALNTFQKIENQPVADQMMQQIEKMEQALAMNDPVQFNLSIPGPNEE